MKFSEWKKSLKEAIDKFVNKLPTDDEEKKEIINYFNKFKDVKVNWHEKDKEKLLSTLRNIMDKYRSKRQQKQGSLIEGEHYTEFKKDNITFIAPYTKEILEYFINNKYYGVEGEWCVKVTNHFKRYVIDDKNILLVITDGNIGRKWLIAYNPYINTIDEWKDNSNSNDMLPDGIQNENDFLKFIISELEQHNEELIVIHEKLSTPPKNSIFNFNKYELPNGEVGYFFYNGFKIFSNGDDIYEHILNQNDVFSNCEDEEWITFKLSKNGDLTITGYIEEETVGVMYKNLLDNKRITDFLLNKLKYFYNETSQRLEYNIDGIGIEDLITQYYVYETYNDIHHWYPNIEDDWVENKDNYEKLFNEYFNKFNISDMINEFNDNVMSKLNHEALDFSIIKDELNILVKDILENVYKQDSDNIDILILKIKNYIYHEKPVNEIISIMDKVDINILVDNFKVIEKLINKRSEKIIEYLSQSERFCFYYTYSMPNIILNDRDDITNILIDFWEKYIDGKWENYNYRRNDDDLLFYALRNIEKNRILLHTFIGKDIVKEDIDVDVLREEIDDFIDYKILSRSSQFIIDNYKKITNTIEIYCKKYESLYTRYIKFLTTKPIINSDYVIKIALETDIKDIKQTVFIKVIEGYLNDENKNEIERLIIKYKDMDIFAQSMRIVLHKALRDENIKVATLINILLKTDNKNIFTDIIPINNFIMEYDGLETLFKITNKEELLKFIEKKVKIGKIYISIKQNISNIIKFLIYLNENNKEYFKKYLFIFKNYLSKDVKEFISHEYAEYIYNLKNKQDDLSYIENEFMSSVKTNDFEALEIILKYAPSDFNPAFDDNACIKKVLDIGRMDMVKFLYNNEKIYNELSDEDRKEIEWKLKNLKEWKKLSKKYGADENIKLSLVELYIIKDELEMIREHYKEKDWTPVYIDEEKSIYLKKIFNLEDGKFYQFLITDTNEVLRIRVSNKIELLDITEREKEMFAESPHIKINNFVFDLEIEKVKDIFELVNYFRDVFSGKIIKDKYNNTLSLKTKEERNQFLNDLLDNEVFKNYLDKLISDFDVSKFYKFFNDYINLEDSETYKSEIGLAVEEAIYLNKEFFDNNIDLKGVKFSLKELNINSYPSFRKSILEKLYNIYLLKNRKCLNENRSKKLKTTFKTVVNNYGNNNFNNWIKL